MICILLLWHCDTLQCLIQTHFYATLKDGSSIALLYVYFLLSVETTKKVK